MKSAWGWILVVGLVVAILIAVNYKGAKKNKSLSEIFPEETTSSTKVEYETVNKQVETPREASTSVSSSSNVAIAKATLATVKTATTSAATTKVPEKNSAVKSTALVFAIQVASFKEEAKAKIVLEALKKKDYSASLSSKDLKEKGNWYRVYVGNFDTKSKAQEVLAKLKDSYKESFLLSVKP